jgi:glucose-1-phosphate thymidylyltransferase
MVLGDNIFFGQNFSQSLQAADARRDGATVFGYLVQDPERYGVVELGPDGKALGIEEKPAAPKSNYAVTGLYFYDGRASEFARTLKPSHRGELEITALNQVYLEAGELNVELLGRGFAWLDTGTHDSLIQAGEFIRAVEQRQGLRIGCLEEIAFRRGWIDAPQLRGLADTLAKSEYGQYLRRLADEPLALDGAE